METVARPKWYLAMVAGKFNIELVNIIEIDAGMVTLRLPIGHERRPAHSNELLRMQATWTLPGHLDLEEDMGTLRRDVIQVL